MTEIYYTPAFFLRKRQMQALGDRVGGNDAQKPSPEIVQGAKLRQRFAIRAEIRV